MKKMTVNAAKPYAVFVKSGFSGLKAEAEKTAPRALAVYDETTYALFSEDIKRELGGYVFAEYVFPSGERAKAFGEIEKALGFFAEKGLNRGDAVMAIGGGATGDAAGFASSVYMRGTRFIDCPTTVLSAVDSCVGGKTAVDFGGYKNLVGTFYDPDAVFINTACFKSLPEREIRSGRGEMLKYAFLSREASAEDLSGEICEETVLKCLEIKKRFVEEDPFDRGQRKKLNLGHTIGHAIESASGFSLSHGECVAMGISAIIDLSADFYGLSEYKTREMKSLVKKFGFGDKIPFGKEETAKAIRLDKKSSCRNIDVALIRDIGDAEIVTLPLEEFIGRLKW